MAHASMSDPNENVVRLKVGYLDSNWRGGTTDRTVDSVLFSQEVVRRHAVGFRERVCPEILIKAPLTPGLTKELASWVKDTFQVLCKKLAVRLTVAEENELDDTQN